jgi:hypothetical protein
LRRGGAYAHRRLHRVEKKGPGKLYSKRSSPSRKQGDVSLRQLPERIEFVNSLPFTKVGKKALKEDTKPKLRVP